MIAEQLMAFSSQICNDMCAYHKKDGCENVLGLVPLYLSSIDALMEALKHDKECNINYNINEV